MVGLLTKGGRYQGESQAPGLTQGEVSSRAGSPHRRQDARPDREGVWCSSHLRSVGKKTFLERGAEVFAGDRTKEDYERRIAELEQLLGKIGPLRRW
jgi:hypothetical protein